MHTKLPLYASNIRTSLTRNDLFLGLINFPNEILADRISQSAPGQGANITGFLRMEKTGSRRTDVSGRVKRNSCQLHFGGNKTGGKQDAIPQLVNLPGYS